MHVEFSIGAPKTVSKRLNGDNQLRSINHLDSIESIKRHLIQSIPSKLSLEADLGVVED